MYKKKIYFEVLRIIACFFVIFNHTGYNGFLLFSKYDQSTIQYWVYLFFSIFCKFSVPVFFMISGALLLKNEETFLYVLTKRIPKMVCVLILTSLCYYIFLNNFDSKIISLKDFIITTYQKEQYSHLWYLYEYIPFLLSLPLLQSMVKELKESHFIFMIISTLFFSGVLPVLELFFTKNTLSLNSHLRMDWIGSYTIIYPFVGYFIDIRVSKERIKKWLPYLWIINIFTILISCVATFYLTSITSRADIQTFHKSFSLINGITIFCTAKCCINGMRKKLEEICLSIGSCTFGIYLFHIIIRNILISNKMMYFLANDYYINPIISTCFGCSIVMIIGYFLTLSLKRLPLINKLL